MEEIVAAAMEIMMEDKIVGNTALQEFLVEQIQTAIKVNAKTTTKIASDKMHQMTKPQWKPEIMTDTSTPLHFFKKSTTRVVIQTIRHGIAK